VRDYEKGRGTAKKNERCWTGGRRVRTIGENAAVWEKEKTGVQNTDRF